MFRRFGVAGDRGRAHGPRLVAREDEEISESHPRRSSKPRASRSAPTPSASAWRCTTARRRSASTARRARPRSSAATSCSPSAACPNTDDLDLDRAGIATDDARLHRGRRSARRPTSPASGRSATATAAAPSPTPPTTISRSSPPTCSTASDRKVSDRMPGLRALHRSAARPGRHDRGRGAQDRPAACWSGAGR